MSFATVSFMSTRFIDESGEPAVHGYLQLPAESNGGGIVLTHGAGSNCQAKLLIGVSEALAARGFTVLRFDLPFRVARAAGPPRPGDAARDREGIRRAASLLKAINGGRLFAGGHSYGGRQASMALAEWPEVAEGLLLLSYPLHPPKKPQQLRTKHFPELSRPAFFVHGTRDPFGSVSEIESALKLIPGRHGLFAVEGASHDLTVKKSATDVLAEIAERFTSFTLAF